MLESLRAVRPLTEHSLRKLAMVEDARVITSQQLMNMSCCVDDGQETPALGCHVTKVMGLGLNVFANAKPAAAVHTHARIAPTLLNIALALGASEIRWAPLGPRSRLSCRRLDRTNVRLAGRRAHARPAEVGREQRGLCLERRCRFVRCTSRGTARRTISPNEQPSDSAIAWISDLNR